MALLATRAFLVAVFDPGSTPAARASAVSQMTTKLQQAGFTAGQLSNYEQTDTIVRTPQGATIAADVVVVMARGAV